ncbi:MAG TPA: hypothetical protein VN920_13045 [Pyrinomonadaceae bacterium]|nr:hypothetical protein [Pyrinomonadaceae bacterium]
MPPRFAVALIAGKRTIVRDAALILELMVRGEFPRIHHHSQESRAVLQQLRYRQRLVKMRTMLINSLLFMAASRGLTLRGKLQTKHGEARLRQLPLPPHLALQRGEQLQLLAALQLKDHDRRKVVGTGG